MTGVSRPRRPGARASTAWAIVIAALATAATVDFRSVFDGWSFLAPAAIGALVAVVVVLIGRRFGLLLAELLASALLVLGLATVFVVGGLPTPTAVSAAIDAIVGSWSDLLSAVPPAAMTPRLRFPPMFLGWLGSLIGTLLVLRAPRLRLAVAGPIVTLVVTILLTENDETVTRVIGVILAVTICASAFVGGRTRRSAPPSGSLAAARSMAAPAVILIAVALAALTIGPRLPLATANDRYGLRDKVVTPWNPLAVPSPLGDLKASLADERVDQVVFSVVADEPIERFTLAVMRDFDGMVWTVADSQNSAADEFKPVGPDLPDLAADDVDADTVRQRVDATITVESLDGPWIPSPGEPRRIEFGQPGLQALENLETGTLALPSGLPAGSVYTIGADVVTPPNDLQLSTRRLPPVDDLVDLEALPPAVRNYSADLIEGIDRGWGQIAAIRDQFTAEGFYDRSTRTGPGHSYYRMGTFLADPQQIVGFEEQYAAAAALISRVADLPARVVIGYLVPSDRWEGGGVDVLASDVSAWIEVDVDGLGWLPVDVSPPRSREPNVDQSTAAETDVATPNPPPPPQPPPNVDIVTDNREPELEDIDDDEEEPEEQERAVAGSAWWSGPAGIAAGASALLLMACAIIVGWKLFRTHRRRSSPDVPLRIAGAWDDLTDRLREAHRRPTVGTTPLETARDLIVTDRIEDDIADDLTQLVRIVDRSTYHADMPAIADADDAWRHYEHVVGGLRRDRSVVERVRMRLDPRPLSSTVRKPAMSSRDGDDET